MSDRNGCRADEQERKHAQSYDGDASDDRRGDAGELRLLSTGVPRARRGGARRAALDGPFWELEVDPAQLEAFRALGVENQEASTRLEPGVLMMHAVQFADAPTRVRVLEIYASQAAYEAHTRMPHFRRYKTASAQMVTSQKLVPINPVLLCAKGGTIVPADAQGLMVRMAVISVDPTQLDAYKAFLTEEQEASVRLEPGVLMLHSIQYAEDPTQVRLL